MVISKERQTVRPKSIAFISICIILIGILLIYIGASFLLNLEYFVEKAKKIPGQFSKTLTPEEVSKLRISLRNNFVRDFIINSIVGLFCVVVGVGLLRLKNWARKLIIGASGIGVIWFTSNLSIDIYKYNSFETFPLYFSLIIIFIFLYIFFRLRKISAQFIR